MTVSRFPKLSTSIWIELKKRLLAEGIEIKKSELLPRHGLALLVSLDEDELQEPAGEVPLSPDRAGVRARRRAAVAGPGL